MISLSIDLRNARLDAVRDAIDAGGGAGSLRIYPGARVGDPSTPPGQVLLVEAEFQRPCAPDASAGVLTFAALTEPTILADGTAAWARIVDSTGTGLVDLDIGQAGIDPQTQQPYSNAPIKLSLLQLAAGGTLRISSATLSAP